MDITVRLGDPLWRHVGTRRLSLHFAPGRVALSGVLEHLRTDFPQIDQLLRQDEGRSRDGMPYHLFLNHKKIAWDDVDRITLKDGDQIAIFLLVVGG